MRKSTTLRWPSVSVFSIEESGRAATFQPSVSTSRTSTNQLTTGENFTPSTCHAESDNESDYDKIRNHIAPLIMDQIVMPRAQSHQADPNDVDRYHRGAGKKGPKNILRRPWVLDPLRDGDPA